MVRGGKGKAKSSKTTLCAAGEKGCVKPDGTVTWVFCEACTQWYHCPCANIDGKKANDEDFIFHCKSCKPAKEKEFNAIKPELKRQIGLIMDRYPVFSTALIARRCFASKSASNEYHFGRPGIPVTLRELEEKLSRDIASMDQFKHMATVMAERMVSSVKGEFTAEAKAISRDVDKLLKGIGAPQQPDTNSKSKKGNKENNVEVKSSSSSEEPEPKKNNTPVSRSGKKGGRGGTSAPAASAAPPTPRGSKKVINSDVKKGNKETAVPMEIDSHKCDMCNNIILAPMYQCLEFHVTCHLCFQKAVRGYCPVCQKDTNRNRRAKKHDNWSTVQKRPQNENVANDGVAKPNVATVAAKEEDVKPAVTAAGGRKRKADKALAPVNSNRVAKVQKTASAKMVTAKIITGSPGSPAKFALAGNNLVNLSALSQPLPPQVVLPTTPLTAPQVQNLKSTAPPPQLIQLRPTMMSSGSGPTTMQIRPVHSGTATLAPGLRPAGGPQFFKIVGGKPVQISSANLHRLPAAAINSLQPQTGSRMVYMRGPAPLGPQLSGPVAVASGGVPGGTLPQGNKIILLSNKGQAVPVSKGALPAPPSIVRIVSPNSVTAGAGGKLTLSPASPTKLAELRPATGGGTTGPILLRTVAPRPTSGAPPIQLPMAPLPRSALNANVSADKVASDAAATAKAIQVLLPKSPLPQNATGQQNAIIKSPGGTTTTTTTTASGAFVWTNSTRANFKLSSRINFASLDKFKNVVNKDVHFILANIVTEDKSNEFSFRLHLKRETVGSGKGKKAQQQQQSYLELEAKAKVPTAQEWSLKVKTEPPVFLVSGGNFLSDFPAVRIPKEIAEKPFVDYELHIDKCSPTQVATGKGAVAKAAAAAAAAAASPSPKRSRKVAVK